MFASREGLGGGWAVTLLLALAVVAGGCSQSNNGEATNNRQRTQRERHSPRVVRTGNEPSGQNTQGQSGGTELWFFGVTDPKLTEPFDVRGVRQIIDLRTIKTQPAIDILQKLADNDLGVAICIRWANPHHGGERAIGRENFDVPPTARESETALDKLREILTSEPARRIGDRFYIEIYNEIGGGPGRFAPEDTDAMMAFADRVVPVIRRANPQVKISGPAISGGQLAQYGERLSRANQAKADLIDRWVKWTAEHADVADVHLNGLNVEAKWVDQALTNMRTMLDQHGGQQVGLISLEWSCSGYSDRNDAAGIRQYIKDVWASMNEHHLQVAAYTYWPLFERDEEFRDRTSWASVVGPDKRPNQAVWDTLVEIGHGR